jgi:hypothetical protein
MPVRFEEASHRYVSHKGYDYISVTTLIKQYTPPFDEDFWSAYKALERVLTPLGLWADYKRNAGGWENVVAVARADKAFPYRKEVIQAKRDILAEWHDTKTDAAAAGTMFHKSQEKTVIAGGSYIDDDTIPVLTGKVDLFNEAKHKKIENGLLTELLVYDDDFEVAGQADWVLVRDGVVHIKDYKTSKEIKMKAFQDEVLLHPLGMFPNCNFYTYSIQLSLYAFILERIGYKIGMLSIEHVDRGTFDTIAVHPVGYHRDAVINLLTDYSAKRKKKISGIVPGVLKTGTA